MAYSDKDRLRRLCPEAVGISDGDLDALLDDASAAVDAELGSDATLYPTASGTPSGRRFYGTGTAYLFVGSYAGTIDAGDVVSPNDATVPAFRAANGYLVAESSTGLRGSATWPSGEPFDITADWGGVVPAAAREATELLCVAKIRENFAASEETWRGPLGTAFDWPPRARQAIEGLRFKRALQGATV